MLDALKFEVEGKGENSSHCKQNATAKTNTLDESIADAEPKSDETAKSLGDAVEKHRPNNDAKTNDEAPLASLLRWLMSHPAAWAMGRMAARAARASRQSPPRAWIAAPCGELQWR